MPVRVGRCSQSVLELGHVVRVELVATLDMGSVKHGEFGSSNPKRKALISSQADQTE